MRTCYLILLFILSENGYAQVTIDPAVKDAFYLAYNKMKANDEKGITELEKENALIQLPMKMG